MYVEPEKLIQFLILYNAYATGIGFTFRCTNTILNHCVPPNHYAQAQHTAYSKNKGLQPSVGRVPEITNRAHEAVHPGVVASSVQKKGLFLSAFHKDALAIAHSRAPC